MEVLVSLGPHLFYAVHPSFERLRNSLALDWRSQRRIGRRPGEQFIGPGNEEYTITGVLYPERFGNGLDLIAGLRSSGLAGDRLPLIEMSEGAGAFIGEPMGLFVITHIDHTRQHYGKSSPRKVEFSLTLRAYGEDKPGGIGGALLMGEKYVTHQKDRLDKIARRAYGSERAGAVERILDANPGLSEQSPTLPAGVEIDIPDPPAPTPIIQTVKLWD